MGFLNKLFNINNGNVNEICESGRDNTVNYYRNKYKLMEEEGKYIDWYEFNRSVEKNWPYPVATEAEANHIQRLDKQALRNHAIDIVELLFFYVNGLCEDVNDGDITIYNDMDKAMYWKDRLVRGAENGNRSFQAALVSDNSLCSQGGWMTDDERKSFCNQYKEKLINDAKNEDPYTMYAVAEFCLGDAKYESDYRSVLAEKAMNKGVGDAAFLCRNIYESRCYKIGETCEFSKTLRLLKKGADCDNGAMLGLMQDWVADAYREGEDDFPKDVEMAEYYYRLAISNGYEMAENSLRFMEEHPELY